ncbi:hypothetical protein S245_038144, partial [Arachis hypogaea]
VKQCAEMSRKLRFFKDQINKAGIMSSHTALQPEIDLEDLEIQLAEHEHELIEMNSNSDKLRQSYNELLEFKIVLQKVSLRLTDLEATLDMGLRHRKKALASVGEHLSDWMNMIIECCDTHFSDEELTEIVEIVKRTLPPPLKDVNGAEATKSNGEQGGEQMETIGSKPRPSAEYLEWWFCVARRFLSHDRLLIDPRAGGVPVDAPVRGHVAAPARQQGPNVPDNRQRATCARVGTRYSHPVGARFEDAFRLDEDLVHHDDDGGDGGDDGGDRGDDGGAGHQDGWGGGGGGGASWGGGASGSGWDGGGGGSGWGGGASGSGWGWDGGAGGGGGGGGGGLGRGGGSSSRGHYAGDQSDADDGGVEETLFHYCSTEGGSG